MLEALARFGPLAPKELNEKTGIPKRTLTLALKRLREAGAVSQEGRRYTAQEFDAQAAAEHFGTDGRQARQMERHEAERVAWKKAQREHAHLKHNRNRKEKAPEPQAETVPATPPAPAIAPVGLAEKWTGNVKAPAGVDPWTWYRENRGRVIPDGERIKLKYPPTLAAFVREHEREIKIAAHREWAAVALSA